jgi:hypothetical protein
LAAPAVPQGDLGALAHLVELVRRRPPPPGYFANLPERGDLFVRAARGPREMPTVVLLHGWIASGGLNWFQAFEALRGRYRVIAPDLRGHARGIRSFRFKPPTAPTTSRRSAQAPDPERDHRRLFDGRAGRAAGLAALSRARLGPRARGHERAARAQPRDRPPASGIMEAGAIAGRVISLRSLFRSAMRISADPGPATPARQSAGLGAPEMAPRLAICSRPALRSAD